MSNHKEHLGIYHTFTSRNSAPVIFLKAGSREVLSATGNFISNTPSITKLPNAAEYVDATVVGFKYDATQIVNGFLERALLDDDVSDELPDTSEIVDELIFRGAKLTQKTEDDPTPTFYFDFYIFNSGDTTITITPGEDMEIFGSDIILANSTEGYRIFIIIGNPEIDDPTISRVYALH